MAYLRLVSLVMLFLSLVTSSAYSAVYDGEKFTYYQPDGTTLAVQLFGDEDYADEETTDGWRIVRDPTTNFWCYARLSDKGQELLSSGMIVGSGDPAILGVVKHLRINRDERLRIHRDHQIARKVDSRGRPMEDVAGKVAGEPDILLAPPSFTTTGSRRGLTLLIQFPDRLADVTIPQADVVAYCNQESGYTGFSNNGSVRQFFYDVSGGKLNYTNHVTAYFTAANNRSYYTDNTISYGTRARELMTEALVALENAGFDFRTVDADSDGKIDAMNCFYAGATVNAWAEGLWPHASGFTWTSASTGVKTNRYQITNMGNSLTLGTFCHENGHMLCGYPDVYDYDYDSRGGAGTYCLMNSGGSGTNPRPPCAYLRYKSGWGTVTNIDATTNTLPSLTAVSGNLFLNQFLLYSKNSTEYFIIENRYKSGRDNGLPSGGGGIAIWHIDQSGDHSDQRYAHQSSHQNYEIALIQADNQRDFERDVNAGEAVDLYYSGNADPNYEGAFHDNSDVKLGTYDNNAHWWDGTNSGMSLSNFSVKGNTMSLLVGAGAIVVTSPNGGNNLVAGASHTVTWNSYGTVDNVTISISTNGGSSWSNLVTNTTNDGTQNVTLPSVSSSFCLMRVAQTSGSTITDVSDSFFTISDTAQEMDVARSGSPVADGGTDSVSGSVIGVATDLVYNITNPGGSNLTVSTPTTGSLVNCTASIVANPPGSIAGGGSGNTTIRVTPSATGAWSVAISIVNNDGNENPYNWTISGTAIAQPVINLKREVATIADNSTDATGTSSDSPRILSYRFHNDVAGGGQTLLLTGTPEVTINTLVNCTVTVSEQPVDTIAAGYNSPFKISVTPTSAGAWSFKANVANNDADRNPYNWTITGTHVTPPVITTQPSSVTIATNTSTILSVVATNGPLTYQWYQGTSGNTANPVGTNSATFTTPNLASTTSYWVRITNTAGSVNSNTATVTTMNAPVINTHPASKTITSGASEILSVVATGPSLTYQWYEGTTGVTTTPVGTNSASYTTPALTVTTSYWVRVSNTVGAANSNTATLDIPGSVTAAAAPESKRKCGLGSVFGFSFSVLLFCLFGIMRARNELDYQ